MLIFARKISVLDTSTKTIKIGTRGSLLALWQANFTIQQLKENGIKAELEIIKTKGDKIQDLSFDKIEGKGFFTKEIEEALLRGDVDMAVHSMKDLPTNAPDGLTIAAVSYREDPSDWLVLLPSKAVDNQLFKLHKNAVVGTSSARRKAQLLDYRPDVQLKDIRGNVPTRIEKLRKGDFDAIVLAAAGIKRLELDLSDLKIVPLNPKEFIPSPAQGVLAFQTCEDNINVRRILKLLHQPEVSSVTNVERKVLNLMDGGCHLPLGVYCEKDAQGNYHVWAAKADTWNSPVTRVQLSSSTSHGLAEKIVTAIQNK